MSNAPFLVAPLDAAHERTGFHSGSDPLDRYLREQVTQDIRRRVVACFVALADLPASIRKKLPRYPTVPAVRMGRLAVDEAFSGQGLGGALLADALERAARPEIAAHALMVDAKDGHAAVFFGHHGFIAQPDSPLTLFLPLTTALQSRNPRN